MKIFVVADARTLLAFSLTGLHGQAVTSDHRMMFDNSLNARRNRLENDIRQEIWRRLGGTQTGPE